MVLNKLGLQQKETQRKIPYVLPKGIFEEKSNRESWLEIVRRLVVENIKNKNLLYNGFIELDNAIFESKDTDILNVASTLKSMNIDSPFCTRKAYLGQLEIESDDLRMRKQDRNHPDLESCMVYILTFCNLDYASKEVLDYVSSIAKERNKEKLDDLEKRQIMEAYLDDPDKNYPRTPIFIKGTPQLFDELKKAALWVIKNTKGEDGKLKYIYTKNSISPNDLTIIFIGGSIYDIKTKDKTGSYQNCWIDDALPVLP